MVVGGATSDTHAMTRSRSVLAAVSLVALVETWSTSATAQNYRSVPIGGRTATMGGAGTAAGNDSAMPYLNPAGLAGLPSDVLAVSASIYGLRTLSARRSLAPNGFPGAFGPSQNETASFSSSSTFQLPSSVMYVKSVSAPTANVRTVLAGSLVVPAMTGTEFIASRSAFFPSTQTDFSLSQSVIERSSDLYIGPTWAVAVGDRFRAGASLYGLYSDGVRSTTLSSSLLLASGTLPGRGSSSRVETTKGYAAVVTAGAQFRIVDNLWVGLGLATPAVPITGKGTVTSNRDDVDVDVNAGSAKLLSESTNTPVDVKVRRPLRINVGVAWDDRERFSIALDGTMFLATEAQKLQGITETTHIETGLSARHFRSAYLKTRQRDLTLDLSLGAEAKLFDPLCIRAGVMTSRSNRPSIDAIYASNEGYSIREDLYGASLGLGLKVGSFDSTAGVSYMYSTGSLPAIDVAQNGSPLVSVETTGHTLMFILSGAVTIAEAQKIIKDQAPVPLQELVP
jgi:hypothetical protein